MIENKWVEEKRFDGSTCLDNTIFFVHFERDKLTRIVEHKTSTRLTKENQVKLDQPSSPTCFTIINLFSLIRLWLEQS